MDNASSCDVLARVLGVLLMERYGLTFHSDNARIRCLAHIVNITVQALLKELDEADDVDWFDWFEGNKHLPIHYDPDDDDEQMEMEAEVLDDIEGTDKVLDEELPEDPSSLSVVKKVRGYICARGNKG
jgi:hypothetical protein